MKKDLGMIISLFIISVIAAGSLAMVYNSTIGKIEEDAKNKMISNFRTVFPEADSFAVEKEDTVYIAYKNGEEKGVVFVVYPYGYAGEIKTLVGMNNDGVITGVITATPAEGLKETPGLGVKVNEDWFKEQFKGKKAEQVILKKDSSEGTIDAITAATISSRAVTDGIKEGMKKYSVYLKNEEEKEDSVSAEMSSERSE